MIIIMPTIAIFWLLSIPSAYMKVIRGANVSNEYYCIAYECMNSQFIANVSVNHFEDINTDLPYTSKPVSVQLIQQIMDSQVDIQELIVQRSEIVQNCGKANWVSYFL